MDARGYRSAKHARETPLAASHVQYALAVQIAKVFENQLDVINARIDGRRKILFIAPPLR